MTQQVRIGTRGSRLALWQAHYVADLLRATQPGLEVVVEIIKTKGDKILDVALSKIGDKGLFTKELEAALLDGSVDMCVHSSKDMPTQLPEGLVLAGFPDRASACDCIIGTKPGVSLDDIPAGSRVATGSLRRQAQLRHLRPDLELCEIRGNVDTRIGKVTSGEFDFAILAEAGVRRLGLDEGISSVVPADVLIPAVGQGCVAIEIREDDARIADLCAAITSEESRVCVEAERFVLAALEGGCQVPMGAHAHMEGDTLFMDAFVASLDGVRFVKASAHGTPDQALNVSQAVVDSLREQGAEAILDEIRAEGVQS